ncbi:MAG: hypothetical protein KDB40_07805 [Acidimicrobiales bacterium]|nr:hypothetical protein [Acidimicrobiales bacterium]MCB9393113.1 hypothetical protein [Acidimicrobiaceae bacterium]
MPAGLRRLACVAVAAAVAALVARWWAERSVPRPSAPPRWPAFADEPSVADEEPTAADGYRAATA